MSLGSICAARVGGDVGVGNLDAIDEPCDLVASTHVQHVVSHVGTGNVVGDDGMEFVRSAPGVCAISVRERSVVGVTVSTLAVSVSVVTVMAVETLPSCSMKWRMGEVSE